MPYGTALTKGCVFRLLFTYLACAFLTDGQRQWKDIKHKFMAPPEDDE